MMAAPIVLGTTAAASADSGCSSQNHSTRQHAGRDGVTPSDRDDVTTAYTGYTTGSCHAALAARVAGPATATKAGEAGTTSVRTG
jgi:hypothetical protein